MRAWVSIVGILGALGVEPGSAYALVRSPFVDGAEIEVPVHAQKLLSISVPEQIRDVRVGMASYRVEMHNRHVVVMSPIDAVTTNVVIWTADSNTQVVVNLRPARSATDAETVVQFVHSEASIATESPGALGVPGSTTMMAVSLFPIAGYALQGRDNAGFAGLGMCHARQLWHRYALDFCATYVSAFRPVGLPTECQTETCVAFTERVLRAATLEAGIATQVGLFEGHLRFGGIVEHADSGRRHEYDVVLGPDPAHFYESIEGTYWRLSPLVALDIGAHHQFDNGWAIAAIVTGRASLGRVEIAASSHLRYYWQ